MRSHALLISVTLSFDTMTPQPYYGTFSPNAHYLDGPPRSSSSFADADSLVESRHSGGPSLTPSGGSGFKASNANNPSQGPAVVNDRSADGLHSPADDRLGSQRGNPQRKGSSPQTTAVPKVRWGTAEVLLGGARKYQTAHFAPPITFAISDDPTHPGTTQTTPGNHLEMTPK